MRARRLPSLPSPSKTTSPLWRTNYPLNRESPTPPSKKCPTHCHPLTTPRSQPACKHPSPHHSTHANDKNPATPRQQFHLPSNFPTSNVIVRNRRRRRRRLLPPPRQRPCQIRPRAQRLYPHASHDGRHQGDHQAGRPAAVPHPGQSLPVVLPNLEPERIMTASVGVLRVVLQAYYSLCASFGEPFRSAIDTNIKVS